MEDIRYKDISLARRIQSKMFAVLVGLLSVGFLGLPQAHADEPALDIVSTYPSDGAKNVDLNKDKLIVLFNQNMNGKTLQFQFMKINKTGPVTQSPGIYTVGSEQQAAYDLKAQAAANPAFWEGGVQYIVKVLDGDGKMISSGKNPFSFTTAVALNGPPKDEPSKENPPKEDSAVLDAIHSFSGNRVDNFLNSELAIAGSVPDNGSNNVPLDQNVEIKFNKPLTADTNLVVEFYNLTDDKVKEYKLHLNVGEKGFTLSPKLDESQAYEGSHFWRVSAKYLVVVKVAQNDSLMITTGSMANPINFTTLPEEPFPFGYKPSALNRTVNSGDQPSVSPASSKPRFPK